MTSPAVQNSPVTVPPHLAVRHIRSYHFLPSLSRTCRKKYQRTTASSSRCAALSSVSSLSASSLCGDFLCLLHHLLRLCVCVCVRAPRTKPDTCARTHGQTGTRSETQQSCQNSGFKARNYVDLYYESDGIKYIIIE
jgi:hypothetical protein